MNGHLARQRAFTLVEMALVLLIIGLLTKTAMAPLAAMQKHGQRKQAEQQLSSVRDAVFAHLVAYGALPCPIAVSSGALVVSSAGNIDNTQPRTCNVSTGYVPTAQLRIAGAVGDDGALLDPWGRKLHYSVSLSDAIESGRTSLPDWTTMGEAAQVGVSNLSADLVLCNSTVGSNCAGRGIRADQIAFVLFSTGADNSVQGAQAENLDGDNYFVVAEESIANDNPFDDLVVWGSAADVMYWMLRMGWLP